MHSLNYTYIITHCASVKNVNSEPQWARMALIAGQKSVKFTLTFFFSRHRFFKPPSCGNTVSCIPWYPQQDGAWEGKPPKQPGQASTGQP